MSKKTIIYAAEYNSCTYEGDFSVISLHKSYETANVVIEKHKKKALAKWKKIGYNDIPDYEQWRVSELELED